MPPKGEAESRPAERFEARFSEASLAGIALLSALADPNDEVLFISALDPWLARLAPVVGARASHLARERESSERWAKRLWAAVGPRTRAVVLPTASDDGELELLAETDVALILEGKKISAAQAGSVHASLERGRDHATLRTGRAEASDELARRLAYVTGWLAGPARRAPAGGA